VDVIKSGGYKISALDIEKELLGHPYIEDVSVMGLSDPVWGQRVFSLIVLKPSTKDLFNEKEFIEWCKTCLPKQSVPTVIKYIDVLPRNQLGKVNKKELVKNYEK
jgi:malonyl-CoA/methylmalonyl-CoA synthetase